MDAGEITERLLAIREGSREALDDLIPLVYERLRVMARARLRGSDRGASLDTTALVHEAYLKLVDQSRAAWRDRSHFFAVAATAMRQILVDRARRRGAAKRGRALRPVTLDEDLPGARRDPLSHAQRPARLSLRARGRPHPRTGALQSLHGDPAFDAILARARSAGA